MFMMALVFLALRPATASLLSYSDTQSYTCSQYQKVLHFYTEDIKLRDILYHYPHFQVSCNGWVSIESAFSPFWLNLESPRIWSDAITQWRRINARNNGLSVFAPFWSDSDTGTISFGEYGKYHRNSPSMLNDIQERMQPFLNSVDPSFVCDYAIVITFRDMLPKDLEERGNTFQLVIAVEELAMKTYVMTLYSEVGWQNQRLILIGNYVTGLFRSNVEQVSSWSNLETTADELVVNNVATTRNIVTGLPGEQFLTLSSSKEFYKNYRRICVDWFREETSANPIIGVFSTQWYISFFRKHGHLRQCPCDLRSLHLGSSAFWRYDYVTSTFWTVCYVQRRPAFGFSTASCCYSWFGSFLSHQSRYFLFSPLVDLERHIQYDIVPRQQCCENSRFCFYYTNLRPRVPCGGRFFLGWFWGDPHITTLDGLKYTFNGLGEYWVLATDSSNETLPSFEVQGRTHRAKDENGTETMATIFTGFAIRNNESDTVQIELSDTRNSLWLFHHEVNITEGFISTAVNESLDVGDVTISKDSEVKVTFIFESGATVTVTLSEESLTISLTCPESFTNRTLGLLGKLNQDTSDDFISKDGTLLPTNMTESEIFDTFGETWRVSQSETLFYYHSGNTYEDYNPEGYRPAFMDELRKNFTEEEWQAFNVSCKGNTECIFDYAVTGNEAVAQATLTTDEENTEIQEDLANTRPTISAPDWANVTLGQELVIDVYGEDNDVDDTVMVSYNLTMTVGNNTVDISNEGELINTSFTWTPNANTAKAVTLTFQAEDSRGGLSAPTTVRIRFCRCNDTSYGECDFNRMVVGTDEDADFQVVECNCTSGFQGDYCTEDIDGCLDNPCGCLQADNCTGANTVCEDVPAEDYIPDTLPYNCGDCNLGYERKLEGENGECTDSNECSSGNYTCQNNSKCSNTIGSYACVCVLGYRLNGDECTDIDECAELSADCDQTCTNTDGSFVCSCFDGFTLDETNTTCIQDADVAALCENSTCDHCKKSTDSQAECYCTAGYELDTDNMTCIDVNECTAGTDLCDASKSDCMNIDGSYECQCKVGHKLQSDKRTCKVCSAGLWGPNCENVCNCKSLQDCNLTLGCRKCEDPGLQGANCADDIDECEVNPCGNNTLNCTNTMGSFICVCEEGYTLSPTDSVACEDIDECAVYPCKNGSTCTNLVNDYSCTCRPGFSGTNCDKDIDECEVSPCKNGSTCTNLLNDYSCMCAPGFSGKNCDKDTDECAVSPCKNGGTCTNLLNDYSCMCAPGFSGTNCDKDIDECEVSPCKNGSTCTNLLNDYSCMCAPGFSGTNCDEDIDECAVSPCKNGGTCTNLLNDYSCMCTPDFTGTNCDEELKSVSGSFVVTSQSWEANLENQDSEEFIALQEEIIIWFKRVCSECQDISVVFKKDQDNVKVLFGLKMYITLSESDIGEAIYLNTDFTSNNYTIQSASVWFGSYRAPDETAPDTKQVGVVLVVTGAVFTDDLLDQTSVNYLAMAYYFTQLIESVCGCRVLLIFFLHGSIKVNYTLEYPEASSEQNLLLNLVNAIDNGDLNVTLDGVSYDIASDSVEVGEATLENVVRSGKGQFKIANKELSDADTAFTVTLKDGFKDHCQSTTEVGYCKLTSQEYSSGSIVVDFTLELPASVTDEVFFDTWLAAIKEGTFLPGYSIVTSSLVFGNETPDPGEIITRGEDDSGLNSAEIAGITVGISLTIVAIILVVITLLVMANRKSSSSINKERFPDRRLSDDLSSSGISYPGGYRRGMLMWQGGHNAPRMHRSPYNDYVHRTGPYYYAGTEKNEYYDSADQERMRNIHQAMQNSGYIDWTAVRNFTTANQQPQPNEGNQPERGRSQTENWRWK